jgi:hypothetical protein
MTFKVGDRIVVHQGDLIFLWVIENPAIWNTNNILEAKPRLATKAEIVIYE